MLPIWRRRKRHFKSIRTEISVGKYLSQLYFEGSNSERERELLWRNTLTRPFSAREGQSARLPRTMQLDDNVTQYLLFFSLSLSFNSLIALAVWALPWLLAADQEAGQKWKSWAGHHTSACYASPLGRAWGNLMFGGKATSSGRCPLMTSLTFPPALSKSWNWPKVFAVIAKKYHNSTNSVRWLGISDLVEQLKCVLCKILDPGGREENNLLFAWFPCLRPMWLFSWLSVWFNTGYIWVIERLVRSGRRRNIYFDFFFW